MDSSTRALREFIIPLKKVKHSPLLPSFSPPPLFLAQLSFLFIRKKERILPCLVASCIGVYYLPVHPLMGPYPLSLPIFHLPSPFRPFPMCSHHLAGIFDSERTSSIPCKCRHKRNEASHLTLCN